MQELNVFLGNIGCTLCTIRYVKILSKRHYLEKRYILLKRPDFLHPGKSSMDFNYFLFSRNITFDLGHWNVLNFRVLKFLKSLVMFDASLLMNVFRSCSTMNYG